MAKKERLHEGKSYGLCVKCNKEFKLKRKTKHNKDKRPKGICKDCSIKKAELDDKHMLEDIEKQVDTENEEGL
jgi:hypothetical protein